MELNDTENYFQNDDSEEKCRLYKRRWLMLTIFVLCEISNTIVLPEYTSIGKAVMKYYNISYPIVSWSVFIIVLISAIFIFPSTYVIHKLGLRKSILVGIIGTSLGSWIKLIISPDKFWIIILGQGIIAAMQGLLLSLPAQLAATWFGANEVSTACSIGIFTVSISIAVGYLLPPFIVDTSDNITFESGLFVLSLIYAILSTILIFITFLCFSERPPLPPTLARAQVQKPSAKLQSYSKIIKKLITNYSFICVTFWYGINIGIMYGFGTLLNETILKHYPSATRDVGIIGFLMNSVGALGTIAVGIILDKFKRYKATTWIVSTFYVISTVAICYLLDRGLYVIYILGLIFGFSSCSVYSLGIELGVELTYPIPEAIVVGILTGFSYIFNIGLVYLYSYLCYRHNEAIAGIIFFCILVFANLLVFLVKFDLKRQKALKRDRLFIQS